MLWELIILNISLQHIYFRWPLIFSGAQKCYLYAAFKYDMKNNQLISIAVHYIYVFNFNLLVFFHYY